jgi:DNA-directed RNA polymerase specialized sigma subunit
MDKLNLYTPEKIAAARKERDDNIVKMRMLGMTLEAIAAVFGISRQRVYQIYQIYVRNKPDEPAEPEKEGNDG